MAFLFIIALKALEGKKDYTFILNIKDFGKISVVIFKSNKIITPIKTY